MITKYGAVPDQVAKTASGAPGNLPPPSPEPKPEQPAPKKDTKP